MSDEAKAIEELAKTTGKITEAAREVGGFLAKYTGGPLAQAMGIFEDRLAYARWERQVRLMDRADEFLAQRGQSFPNRKLPLNLAIPILQAGSLEEDDKLQDRYASLLASAADASAQIEIRRAFVSILEDLTPLDVEVLDAIYIFELASPPATDGTNEIWTTRLPREALLERPKGEVNPKREVQVSVMNLVRLGLLSSAIAFGGNAMVSCVHQTPLGRAFFEACSPSPRRPGGEPDVE